MADFYLPYPAFLVIAAVPALIALTPEQANTDPE